MSLFFFFFCKQMIVRPSLERKKCCCMCQIRKVMVVTQVLFYNYSLFRDSFFGPGSSQAYFAVYFAVTSHSLVHCAAGAVQLEKDGCTHAPIHYNYLLSMSYFFQCLLTICTLPPWVTLTLTESSSVALSPSVLLSVKCFPVFKEDVQVCFETLFCEHCSNLSRLLVVSTRKFRIDLFTVTAHFFLGCASSFFFFFFAVDLRFCSVMLLL